MAVPPTSKEPSGWAMTERPAVLKVVPAWLSDSMNLPLPLNVVSKVPLVFSRVTVGRISTGLKRSAAARANTWFDVPAITIWVPERATALPVSALAARRGCS